MPYSIPQRKCSILTIDKLIKEINYNKIIQYYMIPSRAVEKSGFFKKRI